MVEDYPELLQKCDNRQVSAVVQRKNDLSVSVKLSFADIFWYCLRAESNNLG